MSAGWGIDGQKQCEAPGIGRRVGEVDKSLGARADRKRFGREGKAPDIAEIAVPVEAQPQLDTEDGWLGAGGLDPDRRHDRRGVPASQEKALDLLGPEGSPSPALIIDQRNFGEAEGHKTAALVHDPDQERQEVVSESPGTMVPGLRLDRHVNVGQPFADGPSFSIELRGWVGQGTKAHAPAALEKQQQDQ